MNKTDFEQIEIFDSTLRDGAQSEGITFSVEDKLEITKKLDALGVSFIEAGNPGSNPKDMEFFERAKSLKLQNSKLAAFGSTRRKNIQASDDSNVQSLLLAGTETVVIFGKSWDLHVEQILSTTLDENLNMITDTVSFLSQCGKDVIYDAEHFFDGYKNNPDYALKTIQAAAIGGAKRIILCDTNGGSFPSFVGSATTAAIKAVNEVMNKITKPTVPIGIHAHNDCGLAVAVSIAAIEAGAKQIQGTFIGFGERCGNANLSTVIPNLQLHAEYSCIPHDNISQLKDVAKSIAEISNIKLDKNMPYVGDSAFTHKAGMHADGVLKLSKSFEHIDPEAVGNSRRFVMSEVAGRTAIANKMQKYFPAVTKDSPELRVIAERIKELENQGYSFESAEHSLVLEMSKVLGLYKEHFELISYDVNTTYPSVEKDVPAKAVVKVKAGDKTHLLVAEGDGPVHALDLSLRKCLEVFYPSLSKVSLIDYKVRVLDSKETSAGIVRVLITSTDGYNNWTTIGVSPDLFRASFEALAASVEYFLMCKDGLII